MPIYASRLVDFSGERELVEERIEREPNRDECMHSPISISTISFNSFFPLDYDTRGGVSE